MPRLKNAVFAPRNGRVGTSAAARRDSARASGRPHHCHDPPPYRLGQLRPCRHHGRQVGVRKGGIGTNCTGFRTAWKCDRIISQRICPLFESRRGHILFPLPPGEGQGDGTVSQRPLQAPDCQGLVAFLAETLQFSIAGCLIASRAATVPNSLPRRVFADDPASIVVVTVKVYYHGWR